MLCERAIQTRGLPELSMFGRKKSHDIFCCYCIIGSGGLRNRNILTWMQSCQTQPSRCPETFDLLQVRGCKMEMAQQRQESSGTCAEKGACDSVFACSSWHACVHVLSRTWKVSVRLSTSRCLLCWQNPSLPDIMHTVWGWFVCLEALVWGYTHNDRCHDWPVDHAPGNRSVDPLPASIKRRHQRVISAFIAAVANGGMRFIFFCLVIISQV